MAGKSNKIIANKTKNNIDTEYMTNLMHNYVI